MNRLYCNIYRGSQIDGPGKSWFICHQYGKNSSQNETFLCDSAIPIGAGTLRWQTGATHLFVCHQKKLTFAPNAILSGAVKMPFIRDPVYINKHITYLRLFWWIWSQSRRFLKHPPVRARPLATRGVLAGRLPGPVPHKCKCWHMLAPWCWPIFEFPSANKYDTFYQAKHPILHPNPISCYEGWSSPLRLHFSQAQASLGRFLDRRTSSVQDASCAASDAQGRLNRLQEQSRTVPWLWGSVGPVQTQTFKWGYQT